MSHEDPTGDTEASEAQWDTLKESARHWYDISMATRSGNVSRSCKHILGNLCITLPYLLDAEEPPKRTQKLYDFTAANLEHIKKYFELLEDFPEFAKKEMNRGDGFSAEPWSETLGTLKSGEMVDAYEKKLRGGE
jgi:hypothetical protein